MSYFPHNNQNFDEAFGNRPVPRGPPEMRNIPAALRGPPLNQDVNSRRFDARSYGEQTQQHRPDPRNIDMRGGNPADFRMDQRGPPQGNRGMEPPHRHPDLRMDPRHTPPHVPLDPRDSRGGGDLRDPRGGGDFRDPRGGGDPRDLRGGGDPRGGGDLRTYGPPNRVDPRINFSVGLPPASLNGPSLAQSNLLQQNPSHHPQSSGHPGNLPQGLHHQQQHTPQGGQLSMNSPFGPSLLNQFGNRPSVTEIVPVHVDLATFASEPKFQQILLKVKEQSTVNYVSLNRIADDLVESIVIDAPTKEAALLARNLIETHLKLQMKIKAAETRLQRVQTDLFSTQGEIAAGQMVEFMIRPELIGLAIGKKGTRIKQIETETGVSSINVSDNGHIMIYGPDSQSVQRAREQLELHEESFPLNHNQMEWMSDKMNTSVVADLKNGSGLMVGKVNRDSCKLDVVGTNASVQTAKFLLATQLEYIDKQIEIEANEREAREKLNAVRKQYGLTNPQWKSRMARGDRNDDDGRRVVDQNVQYESRGNPNAKNMHKGHDVVDSLVRAAMTSSSTAKGGKTGAEKEKEVKGDEEGVATFEDELDALISYPSENPSNKKLNDARANRRPAKELVMQDTFLGANINLKDSDSEKVDFKGKNSGRDRDNKNQLNNRTNNKNNGGNNDKNQQGGVNNNKGNRQEGNRQEIVKQDKDRGNKGKDKQPALKLINQTSPDASGMLVIPPAPVLVVPPPPPTLTAPNSAESAQKTNQKTKGKRERGKKHDVKQEELELQDEGILGGDEKKPNKEPMLVKLNNPFLEQKVKRSSDEQPTSSSRVVSIVPEGAEKKQERGRNRQERSDSHDLAAGLAGLKVDDAGAKSESPPPGKANKRNRRKKGKNNEKEESPNNAPTMIDGATVMKVISVSELEGKISSFDSHEPPFPRIVKKGPPAIPNKVVVVDEPSGSNDKKEGRSDSFKDQDKPSKGPLTVDTSFAIKSDDGGKKSVVVSPPGLVAPPGLAKTPTPATSTASEHKQPDFHESSKAVVLSPVPPAASPALSTPAPAPVALSTVAPPVVVSPPTAPPAAPASSPSAGKRAASEGAKAESSEASKDA